MSMEFLTLEQIRECADGIRENFEELLNNRVLAIRKSARQWQFFRLCLERTLGISQEVEKYSPQQVIQYKFEVESKLRRYYLRMGQPVEYVFRLVHKRQALRDQLVQESDYPETSGYYLLVRELAYPGNIDTISVSEDHAYIEKVVTACIDAEFEAYCSLPEIQEPILLQWFNREGAAYRDLIHTLSQLRRRCWVLTNPHNPSTKRLLSIEVKEIARDKAVVRTTEYWYLRWWSAVEEKYRYPYRETNHQTYILTNTGGKWLVDENIRPAPRTSAPHRQR